MLFWCLARGLGRLLADALAVRMLARCLRPLRRQQNADRGQPRRRADVQP